MSKSLRDQRTSNVQLPKGGRVRRLSRAQQRELDRMAATSLSPIVDWVRADVEAHQ